MPERINPRDGSNAGIQGGCLALNLEEELDSSVMISFSKMFLNSTETFCDKDAVFLHPFMSNTFSSNLLFACTVEVATHASVCLGVIKHVLMLQSNRALKAWLVSCPQVRCVPVPMETHWGWLWSSPCPLPRSPAAAWRPHRCFRSARKTSPPPPPPPKDRSNMESSLCWGKIYCVALPSTRPHICLLWPSVFSSGSHFSNTDIFFLICENVRSCTDMTFICYIQQRGGEFREKGGVSQSQ